MSEDAGFKGAWRRRDLRLLVTGLAVSSIGDWIYGIALIVFVFERTGSALWVGAASILRLAPYIIFGALGGVLADRFPRRSAMIWADGSRALLMLMLAAVAATDVHVLISLILAFLATAAGTPFSPAFSAAIPNLVDEDELVAANSLTTAVDTMGLVVGPAIGGVLLIVGSPSLAFLVNGITFAISAASVGAIRADLGGRVPASDSPGLVSDLKDGFTALRSSPMVVLVVGFVVGLAFLYGHELVLLVLVAEGPLEMGPEGVGWLDAGVGVGGLVAAFLATRLAGARRTDRVLFAALLCAGLPLAAISLFDNVAIAIPLMAIVGVGSVLSEVVAVTMMQRTVDQGVIARVFGILDSLSVAAMLAGSLVAPALVEFAGLEGALLAAGLTLPAVSLLALPRLARITRDAETEAARLKPLTELLQQLPAFDGATIQVLEKLALASDEKNVSAGEIVIRRGDPATDLYIIVEGRFQVLTDEASPPVTEMTAPDYFGEIGLLERSPRTATVRASTNGRLLRILGDTFLQAVNTSSIPPIGLAKGISMRMARTDPHISPRFPEKEEG